MSSVSIRRARPEDAPECGRICYQAFCKINADHNFPPEQPSAEGITERFKALFASANFFCVVAEAEGKLVGSNCMDERSSIFGVGPITVDPAAQNAGIGRQLMLAVLDRASERGAPGVRLVQSAFHGRSLSLYAKLGFVVREPLNVMSGPPMRAAVDGCIVRPATQADAAECNQLCARVHGFTRAVEFDDAVKLGRAAVVVREGRVSGYATSLGYHGHALAESNREMQALIAAAEGFSGPGILVPSRNAQLFRWCLENGLRVVQPNTLMSLGLYNEPAGAWLPSILC